MVKSCFLFANITIFFADSANVEHKFRDEVFDKGRNFPIFKNRSSYPFIGEKEDYEYFIAIEYVAPISIDCELSSNQIDSPGWKLTTTLNHHSVYIISGDNIDRRSHPPDLDSIVGRLRIRNWYGELLH